MKTILGKLSVCVIGLGWIGYRNAQNFSNMKEDVDLYVCDLDPGKVEQAQHELNVVGTFSSFEQVLASGVIDAVYIALPHHLHCPVAVKAAQAGKHCMVEKPMALSLREADAMLQAADRAGTRLAVAENYQFMPDATEASRRIGEGIIGTVFMVRVRELWRIAPRPGSWWFQRKTSGGGNLISLGVHLIRTLRLLAGGRAEHVHALISERASPELSLEGEDTFMLSVKFSDDITGSVVGSWAVSHPGADPRFAVHGTDGSIISETNQSLTVYSRRIESVQPAEGELRIDFSNHPDQDGFAAECRAFVQWIQTGEDSPIDGREGRKDLEIVEAAYLSAVSGEAVRLPLPW